MVMFFLVILWAVKLFFILNIKEINPPIMILSLYCITKPQVQHLRLAHLPACPAYRSRLRMVKDSANRSANYREVGNERLCPGGLVLGGYRQMWRLRWMRGSLYLWILLSFYLKRGVMGLWSSGTRGGTDKGGSKGLSLHARGKMSERKSLQAWQ